MRRASLALLLVACSDPAPATQAPLTQAPAITLAPGEVLLDVRGDDRIVGQLEPVPPNADPDRVLVARGAGLDGRRVLDARFVGDDLVVLDADHTLRLVTDDGETVLDTQAEAPRSVAAGAVAYGRGEMPDFEVVRAVPSTGELRALAPQVRPAWSPALSPDGLEVVFVTSIAGSPQLYREGRTLDAARFPTMPSAPLWDGDRLVFEDEQGLALVDLRTGAVLGSDPALREPRRLPDGRLVARRGDAYEVIQ